MVGTLEKGGFVESTKDQEISQIAEEFKGEYSSVQDDVADSSESMTIAKDPPSTYENNIHVTGVMRNMLTQMKNSGDSSFHNFLNYLQDSSRPSFSLSKFGRFFRETCDELESKVPTALRDDKEKLRAAIFMYPDVQNALAGYLFKDVLGYVGSFKNERRLLSNNMYLNSNDFDHSQQAVESGTTVTTLTTFQNYNPFSTFEDRRDELRNIVQGAYRNAHGAKWKLQDLFADNHILLMEDYAMIYLYDSKYCESLAGFNGHPKERAGEWGQTIFSMRYSTIMGSGVPISSDTLQYDASPPYNTNVASVQHSIEGPIGDTGWPNNYGVQDSPTTPSGSTGGPTTPPNGGVGDNGNLSAPQSRIYPVHGNNSSGGDDGAQTNPPIQQTNPPIQQTNPPIQQTNPPIQQTNPPIQNSTNTNPTNTVSQSTTVQPPQGRVIPSSVNGGESRTQSSVDTPGGRVDNNEFIHPIETIENIPEKETYSNLFPGEGRVYPEINEPLPTDRSGADSEVVTINKIITVDQWRIVKTNPTKSSEYKDKLSSIPVSPIHSLDAYESMIQGLHQSKKPVILVTAYDPTSIPMDGVLKRYIDAGYSTNGLTIQTIDTRIPGFSSIKPKLSNTIGHNIFPKEAKSIPRIFTFLSGEERSSYNTGPLRSAPEYREMLANLEPHIIASQIERDTMLDTIQTNTRPTVIIATYIEKGNTSDQILLEYTNRAQQLHALGVDLKIVNMNTVNSNLLADHISDSTSLQKTDLPTEAQQIPFQFALVPGDISPIKLVGGLESTYHRHGGIGVSLPPTMTAMQGYFTALRAISKQSEIPVEGHTMNELLGTQNSSNGLGMIWEPSIAGNNGEVEKIFPLTINACTDCAVPILSYESKKRYLIIHKSASGLNQTYKNDRQLAEEGFNSGDFAFSILSNGTIIQNFDPSLGSGSSGGEAMINGDPFVNPDGIAVKFATRGANEPLTRQQILAFKQVQKHLNGLENLTPEGEGLMIVTSAQVVTTDSGKRIAGSHRDFTDSPEYEENLLSVNSEATRDSSPMGTKSTAELDAYITTINGRISLSSADLTAQGISDSLKRSILEAKAYRFRKQAGNLTYLCRQSILESPEHNTTLRALDGWESQGLFDWFSNNAPLESDKDKEKLRVLLKYMRRQLSNPDTLMKQHLPQVIALLETNEQQKTENQAEIDSMSE